MPSKSCACLRGVLLLAAILFATCAWPHATQLSSARLVLHGRSVDAAIEMAARDLDAVLGTKLADGAGGESVEAMKAQGLYAVSWGT